MMDTSAAHARLADLSGLYVLDALEPAERADSTRICRRARSAGTKWRRSSPSPMDCCRRFRSPRRHPRCEPAC